MGSHRRLVPSGFDRGARGAALCVLAAAAAALGVLPAGAAPQDDRRAEVNRLYAEAEHATESYNRADERADLLHDEVDGVRDRIARQQDRINAMRDALGSLAVAQYRSGGLDPSLALMFSDDPDEYLDKAAAIDRISARQAGELAELQTALRVLAQDRVEATRKLSELDRSRQAVARHKRTVERKLARARQLLNAMPDEDRAAHDRASRSPRTPDLTGAVPSSGRAAAAVAAARSAVGRPYVWGASGPATFDCSGLTQWSYAQAGVGLPRTSQAQAHAGRRVPLAQAQPGDLVTYRDDASHVGMYVGNGQVIHAPYPGAPVRYDPVGMMPVSAVTRP
ncbi:NlpC/P60 family protein [Streptomyces beigongshangae]|uniref:C40 family peptidase n=1 Tax=Streptomyces beigongshangae TaxID=2841597 RepID=UPI0027E205D0|nr:NlpC/P60 family protein [Streptomyces sp. REN17]